MDLTTNAVRGGPWFWSAREEDINRWQALGQEHRAWQHIGAVPRSCDDQIARVTKTLQDLETRHGGCDPRMWQWGPDKSLADVFEADTAVYEHRALKAVLAALLVAATHSDDGIVALPDAPLNESTIAGLLEKAKNNKIANFFF